MRNPAQFPAPGCTVTARVSVKYLGPTNYRGSRWKCTLYNVLGDVIGSKTYSYDHALTAEVQAQSYSRWAVSEIPQISPENITHLADASHQTATTREYLFRVTRPE